jgi:hypothetical protein
MPQAVRDARIAFPQFIAVLSQAFTEIGSDSLNASIDQQNQLSLRA